MKKWEQWKSPDRKMYLACTHFFCAASETARYASSADSKRELRPGHDSRNYILRDNSIMFHGWCTHALVQGWYATCIVLLHGDIFSTTSLPINDIVFFAGKHEPVIDIVAKGRGNVARKITANETTNSCFSSRTRTACIILRREPQLDRHNCVIARRGWRAASVNNTISLFTSVPMRFTCIAPTFAFPHIMRAAL